jgi:hypothetical protein
MPSYAPYSYTKLSIYEQCPLKFALQYISKCIPWSENEVFERGSYFHWRLHHYPNNPDFGFVFAKKDKIAEYDKQFDELIQTTFQEVLIKRKVATEYQFFLDENFKPLKTKEGALLLGSIDYIGRENKDELVIVDYKTGTKEGDPFQLELYAMWGFVASKTVKTILCLYAYLDSNSFTSTKFCAGDQESIREKIINRIDTIESDTDFEANTGDHCLRCAGYQICKSQMKE